LRAKILGLECALEDRSCLDEEHGARQEDFGAIGVELREHPEGLLLRQRLRLQQPCACSLVVANEHEVGQRVDAEEGRSVGRVEHLVAHGEAAEQPAQVTLRGRAEVELRLLDEDDEPADACIGQRRDRSDQREPSILGVAVVADESHRAR